MKIIKKIGIFILAFLVAVFVLVATINVAIYIKAKPYIFDKDAEFDGAETVIILGASVLPNRTLSPILKDRVDTAIELYNAKKVSKILVSGDNGRIDYNEVDPMYRYLLDKGVLDQDIFLDYAGFDTYSTMYRARKIFKVTSVLIVSQSFHLPRAVFIAREMGMDAHGINADGGHILWINYIREVFANEKAVWWLLFDVKPKYVE